ncbi:group II intron reverse transcriptase/maturase [Exiguobacterium alkaliphilum]|uniref:group II intron reverse transcriptase/maturase n=1 Tax=Exiguobacterium alkaliphilum TaxID=1428684 RepID=UPI001BA9E906|nr:group II intron reverse transcriptase/maturase [Exiguobacterium alkaliphilum]QUE85073.1 group II intron reverse transcriptase/maturase [Exiguobacterium alkaliphilum]
MSTTINELSEADLRSMKDDLYEASKNGKRNFSNLYELITCRENIIHAIRKVKSNSGFKTKGVDDVTGQEFLNGDADEMFKLIKQNLETYKPQDVRRVLIPKANGKTRPLGISTIMDRVIQTAVANIIEPICEAQFFEHSYGFRPQRGIEHVMARFSYLTTRDQRHWVVEGDIKGYFDNIDHKILINKLYKMGIRDKRVLAIIKKMLKAGIRGITAENVIGTPQGSTISTLLANVYLNDFDHWVSKQWDNFETKYKFSRKDHKMNSLKQRSNLKQGYLIRYADDWVILTSSEDEAIRWKKSCTKYLKDKLKIELSEEKTKITDLRKDRATFVGIDFIKQPGKNGNFTLRSYPNPERLREKRKKLFEALKEIRKASRRNETDMGVAILKYNAVARGLNNFYRYCTMYSIALSRMEWSMKDARLKTKKKRNGNWSPVKHCSNLIFESKKYGDTKTIAWKLQDTTIGLVKLGVGNYKIPKAKAQWENKYSAKGREKMAQATGEKQTSKVRNPFLTLANLPDLIARNTGTKYTLEYFINRPMVFNIDKYKCRHCKKTLTGDGDVEIHHLNPNLPDDEINKVRNLVTLCKTCHIEEHRIQRESKKVKKRNPKSRGSTLKSRRVSKCPEKDILLQLIRTEPYTKIGKRFDVSGNAVKKWAISYGIHEERMFQHKAKGN